MCKKFLIFISIFVLVALALPHSVLAYKAEGFKQINSKQVLKKADKLGLVTTGNEKRVKKDLLKLKKKDSAEFKKKLESKLDNPAFYQSYLQEIEDGLLKVEKAKAIAKVTLYESVEDRWNELKLTALNTSVDKDFKKFKIKLVRDLESTFYLRERQGYQFEAGQWGFVTVSKNLSAVTWKIEVSSKNDGNVLEPGAEEIQIMESGGGDDASPSEDQELGL